MSRPSPPSIDQLQELPLPTPAFSYLPQTWGWLAVLLVVVALACWWAIWRCRRWQRDRYRREALEQLDRLEQGLSDPPQRLQALRELPVLLKRVALSLSDAATAAALSGAQWQRFLQDHGRAPLPDDFAARLFTLAYAPDAEVQGMADTEIKALFAVSRHWIEAHHVAV